MEATQRLSEGTPQNILDTQEIGMRLRERGLISVQERAAFLGLHRATYSAYMTGDMVPSLPAVRRIASRLNVTVDTILNTRWAA